MFGRYAMSKLRAMLLFAVVASVLSACGISVQITPPDASVAAVTSTPAAANGRATPTPVPQAGTATPPVATPVAPSGTAASTPPPTGGLSVGQAAGIKPPAAPDLWTVPTGGQRVFTRPKLYSGALVTILA